MKLSEAILKGCEITKKGQGIYFQCDNGTVYACALGAAYIGLRGDKVLDDMQDDDLPVDAEEVLRDTWSMELNDFTDLLWQIVARNDNTFPGRVIFDIHTDWTREEIATWLAAKGL